LGDSPITTSLLEDAGIPRISPYHPMNILNIRIKYQKTPLIHIISTMTMFFGRFSMVGCVS
jgi:hypothetical protein